MLQYTQRPTWLKKATKADKRRGLPILSFPAAQKLGVTVEALSSPEAYGVRVSETVAKTSLKYVNGQNTVTYCSLIWFND